MKKRMKVLFLLLMAALMAFSPLAGCGKSGRSYTESKISFLDNVKMSDGTNYVVLWQERATTYRRLSSVINVLAPTWLYVSSSEESGTVLLDTAQMGDAVDYASYVQQANKDNIQVWAGVVCSDASLAEDVLTDKDVRSAFVQKVVDFAETSAVNGVNLYFPSIEAQDRDDFTELVRELADSLGDRTLLNACVTFVSGGTSETSAENNYDYKELASACDYLLLMAFEQYGLATQTAGPVCSYEWLYNNVLKMLSMVPSSQMVLILPFYGRDFRFNESGEALWSEDPAQAPVVSYAQVEELFQQSQYYDANQELTTSNESMAGKEAWDKTYHTAYTKFTDTNGTMHVVWYDNEQSMLDKSAIAVQYALAGIGAYEDGYSDTTLWKGVRTAMDGSYFSPRMMQMLRLYARELSVYNPDEKSWTTADAVAQERLLNLLSASRSDVSSGVDTGYVLRGTLRTDDKEKGYEIRWIVKEKNGRYLLVPDNEYTSIITSGQSLWLATGMTPEMLEEICLVNQENKGDAAAQTPSEAPAVSPSEKPIDGTSGDTESLPQTSVLPDADAVD